MKFLSFFCMFLFSFCSFADSFADMEKSVIELERLSGTCNAENYPDDSGLTACRWSLANGTSVILAQVDQLIKAKFESSPDQLSLYSQSHEIWGQGLVLTCAARYFQQRDDSDYNTLLGACIGEFQIQRARYLIDNFLK